MLVRANGIAPAARMRSTVGASVGETASASAEDALRGRRAGDVDVLLHGDRHAVEHAERLAVRRPPCRRASAAAQRLVVEPAHDGVEVRVDGVDPGEVGLEHLTARHLPGADLRRQFECAQLPEFAHGPHHVAHMNDRPQPSWSVWVARCPAAHAAGGGRPGRRRRRRRRSGSTAPSRVVARRRSRSWCRCCCRSASTTPTTTATACAAPTTCGSGRCGWSRRGLRPPAAVKRAALLCLGLAAVAGLVLAVATSWWLLAVGAAALVAGVGLHRRPEALRLPRARRGVRVHVLRAGGDGRAPRTWRSRTCRRVAWPAAVGRRLPGVRPAGGQQPARHPDRHGRRQAHAGGAARRRARPGGSTSRWSSLRRVRAALVSRGRSAGGRRSACVAAGARRAPRSGRCSAAPPGAT